MQFLASPISMTLHVTQSQRAALVLQILGLVIRVGAVVAAAYLAENWIVESYAVSGFVFYFVYLCIVISILKIRIKSLFKTFKFGALIVIAWVLLAVFIRAAHWKLT